MLHYTDNPHGWKTANGVMFSLEKFCQVRCVRMYFFLMKGTSVGLWRMFTHSARVLNEKADGAYMGEEVHADIEAEAVRDVSGKEVYRIRFGLYALLFLSRKAEVTTLTKKFVDHASVLEWLD
jgi:hypothetical protein